jgi:hypothetical protein
LRISKLQGRASDTDVTCGETCSPSISRNGCR